MKQMPRTVRPKTISRQGLLGQKGINLIEQIVLEMGSDWTPTGRNEVGIDGYIEFFDPNSGEALGTKLAVQSKAVSEFNNDTPETFDFWCDQRDLNYWMLGNMPIILVVSRPNFNEAYWVSIKDYFADSANSETTRIRFVKARQRFNRDSFRDLLALGRSDEVGLYLPPVQRQEKLHSNLLRLKSIPPTISVGVTEFRTAGQMWAKLNGVEGKVDGAWLLSNKRIISFHNLSMDPWSSVCEAGTVESFNSSEWSESEDSDKLHQFVELLNRTLSSQIWPRIRYWRLEDCYAYVGNLQNGTTKVQYRSLKRDSHISAVTKFSKTSEDRKYEWLRHMAFRGHFRRIENEWYLEITPTYRFTSDGIGLDRFHEERLKTIKRIEGNRAVLSGVLFWAHQLRPQNDMFPNHQLRLQFGELMDFYTTVGILDRDWQAKDPTVNQSAPDLTDDLFFSSIDAEPDL